MSLSLPVDAALFDHAAMDLLAEAIADPGYGIFPDFLVPSLGRDLIGLVRDKIADDELKRAGIGKGIAAKVRSEIRTDSIFWLNSEDAAPTTGIWLKAMDALCAHFRAALFLPVWSYEGHLASYPPAGFYKPHLDQHQSSLARQVSIITYLNKDWNESDGGQLRLFTESRDGPYIDVIPQLGTAVIFRSADFWHEVLPAKQTRLSLTGWLRGRDEVPV
ncbi:MAG: SM-20-related protein [Verrucomicrobiales bacterium]|jgi:SM-20-related protein